MKQFSNARSLLFDSQTSAILRQASFGFAYWTVFVLVLEPGNILRAANAGHPLVWDRELLRIALAGLSGASVTPIVADLVQRFPLERTNFFLRAAFHVVTSFLIAGTLIVATCPLATWLLDDRRNLGRAIPSELANNWLLVAFAVVTLTAIIHVMRFIRVRDELTSAIVAKARFAATIGVQTRGQTEFVAIDAIDWIESQGNYIALHTGAGTHLVREPLSRFEARLDPERFIRVHRRIIVAVNRIVSLASLESGDAELRLLDGSTLRVSRRYRAETRGRLSPS